MEEFKFEFRGIKMTITSGDISKCLINVTICLCYCVTAYACAKVKCESIHAGSEPEHGDVDSFPNPPINM